ncbi:MAG: DUF3483 domain-containing protein, partial [Hansschlegelia sp.]
MGAYAFPTLIFAIVALAGWQLSRRVGWWRLGAPEEVAWTRGLLALPRRYLVDVHHVVA